MSVLHSAFVGPAPEEAGGLITSWTSDSVGDAVTQFVLPVPRARSEASPAAPPHAPRRIKHLIEQQLETVQGEMDGLRAEVNSLRQRDETLNFYMHRLDEELRLAARLQQDFLPKNLPQLGPIHFHTIYRPAGYVSGDLYDVMRLDERHIGFYMADAVGHGMPAALLTMFLKHALVTKKISPGPAGGYQLLEPGEALRLLNEELIGQNLSCATFATAIYGIINVDTLQVRLARAGHPGAWLVRGDGNQEIIEPEGGLLGIFPGEEYQTSQFNLDRGDRLFLYTDGIEITFAEDEADGGGRWRNELYARRGMTVDALVDDFAQAIDRETGSLEPKDDLTLLVVEVRE